MVTNATHAPLWKNNSLEIRLRSLEIRLRSLEIRFSLEKFLIGEVLVRVIFERHDCI